VSGSVSLRASGRRPAPVSGRVSGPVSGPVSDRVSAHALLEAWRARGRRIVHEADAKRLLRAAGVLPPARAGRPARVAVKIASDAHPHKTEAGLVELDVPRADAARVGRRLLRRAPEGEVLIEPMITGVVGEWIVGCRHDAVFGPITLVGAGGVLVELLGEAQVRLAPTSERVAAAAIARLPAARVLAGVRGGPRGDRAALAAFVAGLSTFFARHADAIEEIEVNPVMVLEAGRGVAAADALVVLRPQKGEQA